MTCGEVLGLLAKQYSFFLLTNEFSSVIRISASDQVKFPRNPKWVQKDSGAVIPVVMFKMARPDLAFVELARQANISLAVDP